MFMVAVSVLFVDTANVLNIQAATSIDNQIKAAQTAYNKADSELKAAKKEYNKGFYGMITWMQKQKNLTTKQKNDLQRAKTVIDNARTENFSMWYGGNNTGLPSSRKGKVTVISDPKDAVSLDNMKDAFATMERINVLRKNDKNYVGNMKRDPAKTNFYVLAIAQTGADRGAGLRRHSSLQISCENLAFGSERPEILWNSEIEKFNKYKNMLKISQIDTEAKLTRVCNKASDNGAIIGHYTNLFWSKSQIMGVGICDYGTTSCYNASKLSNYTDNYAVYTIAEMKNWYNKYIKSIDLEGKTDKYNKAKAKLNSLKKKKQDSCKNHTYGKKVKKAATCTASGGDEYTCTKCGYVKVVNPVKALGHNLQKGICSRCKKTGPYKFSYIWLRVGNCSSGLEKQSYTVGTKLDLSLTFETGTKCKNDDEFVVKIDNTNIMSYTKNTNSTGVVKLLKPGTAKLTVYPKMNPSLKRSVTVEVKAK